VCGAIRAPRTFRPVHGGRHTMFAGFNSLDLFASFGVLSAGDVNAETAIASFLNDPTSTGRLTTCSWPGIRGGQGQMGNRVVALHEALQKHGITHEYYVGATVATTGPPGASAVLPLPPEPLAQELTACRRSTAGQGARTGPGSAPAVPLSSPSRPFVSALAARSSRPAGACSTRGTAPVEDLKADQPVHVVGRDPRELVAVIGTAAVEPHAPVLLLPAGPSRS